MAEKKLIEEEVAKILLSLKAITLNPHKPYIYNTGLISPIYTDCRILMSHPKEREIVRDFLIQKIKAHKKSFDLIAGTATAGIPHASFIADRMRLPMAYVRAKAKAYGKGNQIEGLTHPGQHVAVIEDLVSTGASSLETVKALRNVDANVDTIFSIFTYELQKAKENFSLNKLDSISLTNFHTVIKIAVKEKYIAPEDEKILLDWNAKPEEWGKKMGFEMNMQTPFYDPTKSYDENYDKGPFGAFADGKVFEQKGKPTYDFLGQKIYTPFGIPAGPILNSNFAKAAFEKGFDIVVYKTVRSDFFPCHPFPNVLAIHPNGDLTMNKLEKPLSADTSYTDPLSITNSFGVPSKKPEVWQEDVKKAIASAGKGQVLVLSFMGTVKKDQSQQEFVDDYILAAKLSMETGAKVLETNLSCPNIGNEGLVCYNLDVTKKIAAGIRKVIGNTPLILKVGYYKDDKQLEELTEIVNAYADSVAGINTLQAAIVDKDGNQALPGPSRLRSGVCGTGIKWAGIDLVKRIHAIKEKKNFRFSIEGVGGVMNPDDYFDYKNAGADSVMSATGAMWNPFLAQKIKEKVGNNK